MRMSLSDAKKKLTNLENQLKQLKKELRQIQAATKKGNKGQIKKQIKKIESTLSSLRKYVYEKSKNPIRDLEEKRQREQLVTQQEELQRNKLIQKDLELRNIKVTNSTEEKIQPQNGMFTGDKLVEALEKLGINRKQLNKWSNKIEKNYIYEFSRNKQGEPIFSESDLRIIEAYSNKISGKITERQFQLVTPKKINRGSTYNKPNTVVTFNYEDDPTVCSSCGKKIRNIYGTTRCGCN